MALINVDDPIVSSSAGHGYNTLGKETPPLPQRDGKRMKEKEFNEAVQDYLAVELKRCGIKHVDVDHDITDIPLSQRAARVNAAGAHFHLDIHANAFNGVLDDKAGGIETLYFESSAHSKKVAEVVHKHVMRGTKMKDRGLKPGAWLYMIKNVKPTSILVELGFMDNKHDVEHLLSDAYRRECARELAMAICEIFGKKYVAAPEPSKPAPAKPAPSKPSNDMDWHTVGKGDTLWGISQKYDVTVDQLKGWNKGIDADELQIGQKVYLVLPKKAQAKPAPKPAPKPKKEYAYFPPGHGNWSVYPTNKQPVKKNAIGAINPSKFGGLTYEVLGKPYPQVVTIKTGDFGRVNVFVGDSNSKLIWK